MCHRTVCAGPRLSEKTQLELECVPSVWLPALGSPYPSPPPTLHLPRPAHGFCLEGSQQLQGKSGPLLLPWGMGRGTGLREWGDGGGERMIIASEEEMVFGQLDI